MSRRSKNQWNSNWLYRPGERTEWAGWVWVFRGEEPAVGVEPSWVAVIDYQRGKRTEPPVWERLHRLGKEA